MKELAPTELGTLLQALHAEGVRFIVVGGVAGVAHGAARVTYDLDIVYARDAENLSAIVRALGPFKPYLRGAPPGLPFQWDEQTLAHGLNFTLRTTAGDIDLLGEIPGGGYVDLEPHAETFELFDMKVHCLGLRKLIEVKRAAGRPKDFEAIAELLEILRETEGKPR